MVDNRPDKTLDRRRIHLIVGSVPLALNDYRLARRVSTFQIQTPIACSANTNKVVPLSVEDISHRCFKLCPTLDQDPTEVLRMQDAGVLSFLFLTFP